jgi:hopanoid biosynthesis associated RND transporter like protein HpnN
MLSLTGRVLQSVVRLCCARPGLTVVTGCIFAVLGFGYAAHSLTLETSKFNLLPSHQRYVTLYKEYSEDFGQLEDIVVVVQSPTVTTSTAYAARLAGILRGGALAASARVSYRIDASRLDERGLVYLPLETLRDLLDTAATHEDLLAAFAARPTLDRLVDGINQYVGAMLLPSVFGAATEVEVNTAPTRLLRALLGGMSEGLDGAPYRSPWVTVVATPAPALASNGYFVSDDNRLLYVVIDLAEAPRTFAGERAAVLAIRRAVTSLRPEFPSVQAGVTGVPALFTDEMSATSRDGEIASVVSMVLTLGLLLLAFRRIATSCAMLVVLGVSLGWSMGIVTLVVGHLTVYSMMFVSVVIGIGIDYGIYFLFRYREERALGARLVAALERTAARSGPGILLAALTAATTFYILTIAEFRGIREFGFISGCAILLAFLAMMTVFPAALVLIERRRTAPRVVAIAARPGDLLPRDPRDVPVLEWFVRHPRAIVTTAALLTGASLWAAPRVAFDYDFMNLQAAGTESVVWERKTAAAAGRSGFAALATARSLEELAAKAAAFQRLPSVSDVQSVSSVMPDSQAEKLAVLGRLAAVVDSIPVGAVPPVDLAALIAALETLKRRTDLATARSGGDGPSEEILFIARATSALLARLTVPDRGAVEVRLGDFQKRLAGDFAEQWRRLQRATRPAPVTLVDLPEELRRKFIGKSGLLLLQIYSRLDVWERPGATQFAEELRTVDPDITGQPIVAYESMRLIEQAYWQGLAYAFALVAGIAALMIRRVRETGLAMVPMILGTLWMLAIMQVTGLKFNLVNIWALPLIIGSATEYGVNMVLRALESRAHGGPRLARSTVMGVVFNGLTTIAGFGSLLIAQHRGVWSLGLLLVIGSTTTLIASLVVLPTLLHLADRVLSPASDPHPVATAATVATGS